MAVIGWHGKVGFGGIENKQGVAKQASLPFFARRGRGFRCSVATSVPGMHVSMRHSSATSRGCRDLGLLQQNLQHNMALMPCVSLRT